MSGKREAKPAGRGFDKELAELEELSVRFHAGAAFTVEAQEQVRKALGSRHNFLVAKAARLVEEGELASLLPEVLAAYDRFFTDAVKSDPQCWAKNALVKAMVKLEHRAKDAYIRGLRHHQMEPVWGGSSDTAGVLRCACAHALVDCPGVSDAELLTIFLDPLLDSDKTVRMEAARAIGNVGGVGAVLVLRLRAMMGAKIDQDEPEVLGACYSALLALEGGEAIPLVAAAMKEGDEMAGEAAFALAGLHTGEALAALQARFEEGADDWFRNILLSAIALTRQPKAIEFLLGLIERETREAVTAIEPSDEAAHLPSCAAAWKRRYDRPAAPGC
jgi:HEAT repeat protein